MKPLDGISVLDLTRLLPGAVATMMLGDYGADVIKIEEPGQGDPMRYWRAGLERPNAFFLAANRNKRSLTLNLKRPAGREIFLKLVERADVVIESFRPGVMDRLQLGYQTLAEVNPRLIYCAISGYGQDGPYRDRAGHDINYIAVAGLLGINGMKGGPPVIPGVQMADLAGGSLHAVIGILLALQARQRTGRGQLIDISMTDCVLSSMFIPFATFLSGGEQPQRGGESLTGEYACYRVYETGDGRYLALGALESKFWEAACSVLGRPDLIELQFDRARQPEVIEVLTEIFRQRTMAEWQAAFAGVDTCLEPVKDLAEMVDDPQIRHRGVIAELDHPQEGRVRQIAPLVKLSATPGAMQSPPPGLGEHTRALLKELGYSEESIEDFARDGVT
ncbi:MAG TPA: CaiB/BaiF CoA-transferase family protein [Blastocatellia bacterium]|nr:CaiB/BaiF CoA-transferase family protein [Blastocatellia bacterium]